MAAALRSSSAPVGARWALSDASLEWLKWIAVAAMLLDHVNWFLFAGGGAPQHGTYPWMNDVGRLAFPLFALVFGVNLARILDSPDRNARASRMFVRLFVAGVIAQLAYWVLRGYFWPLNVLATFALAAAVAMLWQGECKSFARRAAAVGLFVVGGFLVEYWWIGAGLILAATLVRRGPFPLSALIFVALLIPLCLLNGNAYALAALVVAAALAGARWAPPRVPGLLHVVYAGHLWALVAVAALFGRLA